MNEQLLRAKEVCECLSISGTTLWRWRQGGYFPEPVSLGPRLIGWERSIVENWIVSKRKIHAGAVNDAIKPA